MVSVKKKRKRSETWFQQRDRLIEHPFAKSLFLREKKQSRVLSFFLSFSFSFFFQRARRVAKSTRRNHVFHRYHSSRTLCWHGLITRNFVVRRCTLFSVVPSSLFSLNFVSSKRSRPSVGDLSRVRVFLLQDHDSDLLRV